MLSEDNCNGSKIHNAQFFSCSYLLRCIFNKECQTALITKGSISLWLWLWRSSSDGQDCAGNGYDGLWLWWTWSCGKATFADYRWRPLIIKEPGSWGRILSGILGHGYCDGLGHGHGHGHRNGLYDGDDDWGKCYCCVGFGYLFFVIKEETSLEKTPLFSWFYKKNRPLS